MFVFFRMYRTSLVCCHLFHGIFERPLFGGSADPAAFSSVLGRSDEVSEGKIPSARRNGDIGTQCTGCRPDAHIARVVNSSATSDPQDSISETRNFVDFTGFCHYLVFLIASIVRSELKLSSG
jgi:hypothetical protein